MLHTLTLISLYMKLYFYEAATLQKEPPMNMLAFKLITFNVLEWEGFETRKAIAYNRYIPSCLFLYIKKDCVQYLIFAKYLAVGLIHCKDVHLLAKLVRCGTRD